MLTANELRRWQTPISSAHSVVLTSLTDEGHLNLTFQASFEDENNLVCFRFKRPTAYSVKGQIDTQTQDLIGDLGNTFVRPKTGPITQVEPLFNYAALRIGLSAESQCELEVCDEEADHYYFFNHNSLIEVCCSTPPEALTIAKQSRAATVH